jgi:hypothetical protein
MLNGTPDEQRQLILANIFRDIADRIEKKDWDQANIARIMASAQAFTLAALNQLHV